jgi:integrase
MSLSLARRTEPSVILGPTRWLVEARERHGFEEWMTFHAWRNTRVTVLDEAGATARMIADQLGHSRVSMTQDVYLGRRCRESRVAAALEGVDPMASGESVGESVGPGTGAMG